MVKRTGGFRYKTRQKLRKLIRTRGKISIRNYFQKFNINDRVQLTAEPSIHKGMYHPRFHGKSGIVMGKQGNCYKILVKDGSKDKTFIIHPIHLKRS